MENLNLLKVSVLQPPIRELLLAGCDDKILYDSTEIPLLQRPDGQWKIPDKLLKKFVEGTIK